MDVLGMIRLLGGVALLLYGIEVMGESLQSLSGARLGRVLEKMTGGTLRALLTGALVTAVMQSSTAVILLTVSLMRSGALNLRQANGIVMGANIGTTVTAQLTRLGGIGLLAPENLSAGVMICGTILLLFFRRGRAGVLGRCLMGFGILFTGLVLMTAVAAPLAKSERFLLLLSRFSDRPLSGVIAGFGLTVLFQSSSAMMVLLQTLSMAGGLTFSGAYPIILGSNLGTCAVTAALCWVGSGREERLVGLAHILFNVIGSLLWLSVLSFLRTCHVPGDLFWLSGVDGGNIADIQTLFNLSTAVILLPFAPLLIRLFGKTGAVRESRVDFLAQLR